MKNRNLDPDFKTANMCGGVWGSVAGCVAVKRGQTDVQVKDTKTGVTQVYTHKEWTDFIDGVKNNEFDL